ncbi:hypothetical protein Tco_0315658 [Tanacetum coccineum]
MDIQRRNQNMRLEQPNSMPYVPTDPHRLSSVMPSLITSSKILKTGSISHREAFHGNLHPISRSSYHHDGHNLIKSDQDLYGWRELCRYNVGELLQQTTRARQINHNGNTTDDKDNHVAIPYCEVNFQIQCLVRKKSSSEAEHGSVNYLVKFLTEAELSTINSEYTDLETTLSVATRKAISDKAHWLLGNIIPLTKNQHLTNPTTWFKAYSFFTKATKATHTKHKPNTHLITVSSRDLLASNTISDTELVNEITSREGLIKIILVSTFKKGKTSQSKRYTKAERTAELQQPNDERIHGLNFTLSEKVRGQAENSSQGKDSQALQHMHSRSQLKKIQVLLS